VDQETKREFSKVHAEFGKVHAKLGRHDEIFERIDEKFERIDGEFRMVHGSFNQVFKTMHEMRLFMEHMDKKIDKLYDSSIDRAAAAERLDSMDTKVDRHEVRIGALEALARKS
jgi:hypothetical protein